MVSFVITACFSTQSPKSQIWRLSVCHIHFTTRGRGMQSCDYCSTSPQTFLNRVTHPPKKGNAHPEKSKCFSVNNQNSSMEQIFSLSHHHSHNVFMNRIVEAVSSGGSRLDSRRLAFSFEKDTFRSILMSDYTPMLNALNKKKSASLFVFFSPFLEYIQYFFCKKTQHT